MEMEEGDERNVLSQYDQEICRWMQTDTDNTLLPVQEVNFPTGIAFRYPPFSQRCQKVL